MLLTAALLFTGCDLLEEAREELTDLTNPLVGQVMIVGIAEPDDPTVAQALEGTDWEQGVFAQAFLADATNANGYAGKLRWRRSFVRRNTATTVAAIASAKIVTEPVVG